MFSPLFPFTPMILVRKDIVSNKRRSVKIQGFVAGEVDSYRRRPGEERREEGALHVPGDAQRAGEL